MIPHPKKHRLWKSEGILISRVVVSHLAGMPLAPQVFGPLEG